MKTRLEIHRVHKDTHTIGSGYWVVEGKIKHSFKTLELPWKNNERRVSCIPAGTYQVIRHKSPKFGECFWIQNVPGRSEILIHQGNFTSQILGCILVGKRHADINGDGIPDVTESKIAMGELLKLLPDKFELLIQ